MMEEIFQSWTLLSLLGTVVFLLILHVFSLTFRSPEAKRVPPGPRPLPMIGNLLQVDLKRLDKALLNLSKTYGSVFTVYIGLKKVVVLVGYNMIKQALVNQADEFGDKDDSPIVYDLTKGNDILFTNGELWKEMRRFALTTLRDFGKGLVKKKIIKECHCLITEFEQFKGKAFENTQIISYVTSNIISAIVFVKRFEYTEPLFQSMVARDQEIIYRTGSASTQIYNVVPWLGPWLKNWRDIIENLKVNNEEIQKIITDLKETLNPEMCRGFVDAFLIHKQSLEESKNMNSFYNDDNLHYCVTNLFAAGTDTLAILLRWCLLLMAKYCTLAFKVTECASESLARMEVFLFFTSLIQRFQFIPPTWSNRRRPGSGTR